MSSTLHSYKSAMDGLHFTDTEKGRLIERLAAATAETPVASASSEPAEVLRMPTRRHWHLRAAAVVATLVVGIGAGTTAAVAAGIIPSPSEVLASVFGSSPAQTQIIDKIGRPIGASATSNGITITAQAVIGDANGCTVVFDITRDDGESFDVTGLSMGHAYGSFDDRILALMFSTDEFYIDGASSYSGSSYICNPDVTSNKTLRYVRQFDNVETGGSAGLNGRTCHVRLSDIESFAPDEYNAHVRCGETLATGTWDLTFQLNYEDATVQLASGQTTTLEGHAVTIDKAEVSPIGVTIGYTVAYQANYTDDHDGEQSAHDRAEMEKIHGLPVSVTFTDGSTVGAMAGGSVSSENADGTTTVSASFTFDEIRETSGIASVTVGDVTIPVAQ